MNNQFHLKTKYCDRPNCAFYTGRYVKGGIYIGVQSDGEDGPEPWMDVTVNLVQEIPKGAIAVKSYSENEGLLEFLLELGLIKRVLCYEQSGYVKIPICEYDPKVLDHYCADKT